MSSLLPIIVPPPVPQSVNISPSVSLVSSPSIIPPETVSSVPSAIVLPPLFSSVGVTQSISSLLPIIVPPPVPPSVDVSPSIIPPETLSSVPSLIVLPPLSSFVGVSRSIFVVVSSSIVLKTVPSPSPVILTSSPSSPAAIEQVTSSQVVIIVSSEIFSTTQTSALLEPTQVHSALQTSTIVAMFHVAPTPCHCKVFGKFTFVFVEVYCMCDSD